jgi:hypothetical protein
VLRDVVPWVVVGVMVLEVVIGAAQKWMIVVAGVMDRLCAS